MSGFTDLAKLENSRNCLRRIARHDEQQFSKDSIVNVMEKFVKTVNVMDETILVPCRLMDRQVGDSTDIIQAPAKTSASHHHHHHHMNVSGNGKCRKQRAQAVHEFLNSADLFNLYNMLNALKNDLLWTSNDLDEGSAEDEDLPVAATTPTTTTTGVTISSSSTQTSFADHSNTEQQQEQKVNSSQNVSSNSTSTTTVVKGHIRRPSTASMASSNSVSNLSDSESEISNENDSGIESEGHCGGSQKGSKNSSNNSQGNSDKATELARQCRQHLSGLYRCLEQMTEAANYLTARYQSDIGPV